MSVGRSSDPWRRGVVVAACLVCLFVSGRGAHGESPGVYLGRVVKAAEAGDKAALRSLAATPLLDPWLVVDRLAELSLRSAAAPYAEATTDPDRDALVTYAKALPPEAPKARSALRAAMRMQAEGKFRDAVAKLETVEFPGNSVSALRALLVLGGIHVDRGNRDAAEAAYAKAASTGKTMGWLLGESSGLVGLQWRLEEAARFAEMRRVLQRRKTIQQLRGAEADLAEISRELGGAHVAVGTPRRAIAPLQHAVAYYDRVNAPVDAAYARVHLAIARSTRGEFARALSLTEEAQRACGKAGDLDGLDYASYVQMMILVEIGKNEAAIRLGRSLLKAEVERGPDHDVAVKLAVSTALAHEGKFDEALGLVEASLKVAQANTLPSVPSVFLHRGMSIRYEQKRYVEALADCKAASLVSSRMSPEAAYSAWAMGASALHLPGRPDAQRYLEKALTLAAEREDADLMTLVHAELAQLYLLEGEFDAAIEQCNKASLAMDQASAGLADDEMIVLRSRRNRRRVFSIRVEAALRLGDPEEVYRAIESGRQRALLVALGGPQAVRGMDIPPNLREQEADLRGRLKEQRERLNLLRDERKKLDEVRGAREALRDTQRQYALVANQIQRLSTSRGSLAHPVPAPVNDVVRRVPKDAAVVLFATSEHWGAALVLSKVGPRIVQFEDWAALRKVAETFADFDRSSDAKVRSKARRTLASRVIDALGLPASTRRLYVSPDGPLTAVPWPAVAEVSARKIDVSLIPSATTLATLGERSQIKTTRKLALGDPLYEKEVDGRRVPWFARGLSLRRLEHSAREVKGIRGPGDLVLLEGDASETRVRRELEKQPAWDVLHFACHGILDEDTPSLSSLALTPTDEDDGFLTAAEIFRLRLRARLVTLAACDVGRGKLVAGEGLLGVVRAFFAAGARRMLVSLWPADDVATTALMKRFYAERAKKGVDSHEALLRAQRYVRESKDEKGSPLWEHPFYWAGWVLWGE